MPANLLRRAVLNGDPLAIEATKDYLSNFEDDRRYLADLNELAATLMAKSDASEVRLRPMSQRFDMETACQLPFFPEPLTPFYGTPVWELLDGEQRLALNHLQFVIHYTGLGFSEKGTVYYDNWASVCVPERHFVLADYLRREAEEEMDHIACFWTLSRKILEHYFPGRGDAVHVEMREFIRSSTEQPLYFRSFSNPALMAKTFELMTHHFSLVAGSFYALRMMGNMRIKSYDIQNKLDEGVHPLIRTMSRDHWEDEARHTAMSAGLGQKALLEGCSQEGRSLVWDAFFEGEVGYEQPRLFYNSYIFGKGPLMRLLLKHVLQAPLFRKLPADTLRAMRDFSKLPSNNAALAKIGAWEVDRYSDMIRRLSLSPEVTQRQLAALQRFSEHPLAARSA
ncbi:MAG TPA: diiron oxygenase [Oscillatoriaceae cyanobacterium]